MKSIFYIGMFLSLFILAFIMNYIIFRPQSAIVKISYFDVVFISMILSLGITLMYMGVFK